MPFSVSCPTFHRGRFFQCYTVAISSVIWVSYKPTYINSLGHDLSLHSHALHMSSGLCVTQWLAYFLCETPALHLVCRNGLFATHSHMHTLVCEPSTDAKSTSLEIYKLYKVLCHSLWYDPSAVA